MQVYWSSPCPLQKGDFAALQYETLIFFPAFLPFHQQIGFTGFEAGGHQLAYLPAL
jgi:hypothetical protein